MSVDKLDVASQAQQAQYGTSQSFWPIIIDAMAGGPNGTQMQIGEAYELNINPCDHVWLPTYYDPSLGVNPAQFDPRTQTYPPNPLNPNQDAIIFGGPPQYQTFGIMNYSPQIGINIFDVYDAYQQTFVQLAPMFSLRFNSPNSPWLLWGLGTNLSFDGAGTLGGIQNGFSQLIGRGDSMRSITGSISRIWVKLLSYAEVWNNYSQTEKSTSPFATRIVLMSTLGFNHQTQTTVQDKYASYFVPEYAPDQPVTYTAPQVSAPILSGAFGGGGYVTPQLSSLDNLEASAKGFGTRVTAEGVNEIAKLRSKF